MRITIKRHLYSLYLIIIVYNILIIHCEIWNDDDNLGIVRDIPDTLLQMQYVQSMMDGSGDTTELSTEMTTGISTSFVTSSYNNTYYSTANTTLGTSFIPSTSSSSTTSTTPATPFYHEECDNQSDIRLDNGTCIAKSIARENSVNTIRSNSNDSEDKASALIVFLRSSDNLTTISNISDTLTPREIDDLIDGLNNITAKNTSKLFIMAQRTDDENKPIRGGLSIYNSTNEFIKNDTTRSNLSNLTFSAAALIDDEFLNGTTQIKMLIINEPTAYKNFNPSNNQLIVSPVIIVSVDKKNGTSLININLHFQVLADYNSLINGRYVCAFLDSNSSTWNQSGCSDTIPNTKFNRYECTCNHLTTFALIWLPNGPQPNYLTSQDIASLVFLSLSILCFIAVIIHSLTIRFRNSLISFEARDLLPLISSASTMIVFIFYIALTMTIYTRIPFPSSTPTPCFKSASVLMFFVYFFLIFMFCAKTSVGYFNYLRFVYLFPQPSYRKLFILLIISFLFSIAWTAFAAGFNSNTSFNITQLHGNKLCWFTRDVIYYFMTIPISIFLLLNFIIIILVAKRIINHARNATSPHQSYERMKRCVLVLLSSCFTQGIGWLFGPFITFVNPTSAEVLGWFFIILNGLEGVWIILLYIIIRSQRIDEVKRVSYDRRSSTKTWSTSVRSERSRNIDGLNSVLARRFRVTHRNARKERLVFHDLYDEETTDWKTGTSEL